MILKLLLLLHIYADLFYKKNLFYKIIKIIKLDIIKMNLFYY